MYSIIKFRSSLKPLFIFFLILFGLVAYQNSYSQIDVEINVDEFQGIYSVEVIYEDALQFTSDEYTFTVDLMSRGSGVIGEGSTSEKFWTHEWKFEVVDGGFFDNPRDEYQRLFIRFEDGVILDDDDLFWLGSDYFYLGDVKQAFGNADTHKAIRKIYSGIDFKIRLYHQEIGYSHVDLRGSEENRNNLNDYVNEINRLREKYYTYDP